MKEGIHPEYFTIKAECACGNEVELGSVMEAMKVDLMSLSAHKMYGPKGIGALYVRRKPRIRIEAQIHGGGHERGMRSGTLPTHQIVGMGEAARIAKVEMVEENARFLTLRNRLWDGLKDFQLKTK